MTLGGELVASEKGRYRGPTITMDLDCNGIVVSSLEGDQDLSREMFCGMAVRRPLVIMWFEMEAEIRTKPPRYSYTEVGSCRDPGRTSLQIGTKVLMAGTDRHGKDLVAMEAPEKAIAHVREGGKSSRIGNRRGIDAVSKRRKSFRHFVQVGAWWSGEGFGMGGNSGKPLLELRFEGSEDMKKRSIRETEGANTFFEIVEADVRWPDEA
jgi:hypothetical protein